MLTLASLKGKNILMSSLNGALSNKTPEEILAEYRKAIADIDSYAVAINNMT